MFTDIIFNKLLHYAAHNKHTYWMRGLTLWSRQSENSVKFHTGNCKVHTGVGDIKT